MLIRLLIVLMSSSSAHAADTCCVDEDIAAAFILHSTYSRDWPADFPLRVESEALEYIGSSEYNHSRYQSVAWKSQLDPQASIDLVTREIIANDWIAMPETGRPQMAGSGGFVAYRAQAPTTADNLQYCRGRDGMLSVQARQTTIGTVVTVSHSNDPRGGDCARMRVEMSGRHYRNTGMIPYLPTLMLPESIETNSGSGAGGGGAEAHASLSVTTEVPASAVSAHFEPQMRDQQWTLEADFLGSKSSGHIWRRTVDGLELVCTVTAIETSDGLHLRMVVQAL